MYDRLNEKPRYEIMNKFQMSNTYMIIKNKLKELECSIMSNFCLFTSVLSFIDYHNFKQEINSVMSKL